MTIIAWDGKTLAADKRMTNGWTITPATTKIMVTKKGDELLAIAGAASMGMELIEWYNDGAAPDKWPAGNRDSKDCSRLIVINSQGIVREYQSGPYPIVLQNKQSAWGAGQEAALAAMMCGADAVRAVEVASAIVQGCGNGVDTLTLDGLKP